MSILPAIQPQQPAPEITYTCEVCGAQTLEGDTFSLALVYRKPGRDIAAFQCPNEQHYACSHEHAVQAVMACLSEHIVPVHQAIQASVATRKETQAQALAAVNAQAQN